MELSKLNDAAVYVGTYKKYNEGSLFGKWMQLADYENKADFYKACKELHKDEEDPEFMFQDWEYIPDCFIGESWIDGKVWDLLDLDVEDAEIVDHYAYACSIDLKDYEDLGDLVDEAKKAFVGHYKDYADLGIAEVEQGCIEIPSYLERYFDYEAFGRDCATDYMEDDGYYFDTNRL